MIAIFVFGLMLQRRREYIVMRAHGMPSRGLQSLVLGEAAFVGVSGLIAGAVVGLGLGLLLVHVLQPLFILPPIAAIPIGAAALPRRPSRRRHPGLDGGGADDPPPPQPVRGPPRAVAAAATNGWSRGITHLDSAQVEDRTPQQLARAVAECRRQLAGRNSPSDIEDVERRLADIERAIRQSAQPARANPAPGTTVRGLRIAVALRQFVPGMGGTGIYTRHVLAGLARDHAAELTIFTVEGQVETLREAIPSARFHAVSDAAAGLSIERDLEPADFDVLFCPLALLDPPRPPLPAAVTIHDLGHEIHPENFDRRLLELYRRTYRSAALNADLILTVSGFSRRTIAEYYGIDAGRITVAPPGASAVFTNPAPLEPSADYRGLELPDDYLYYPANYWLNKNHANLLRAFAILREHFPRLELVFTSTSDDGTDRVADLASQLGVRDGVRMLGSVEPSLVCELARFSRAVTFVSQFEGFGMPILEAMHAGAPVVTSMADACREVGGDAALSAPYDDPQAIAAEIKRVLDDPQLAREMCVRGKRRAGDFDWSRSVAVIADALGRIADRPRSPDGGLTRDISNPG